ncbi:MAG: hypothetical protein K6G73_13165 [Marinilabiliaceae bacterium]|nr:hypothetical protein [Marinilabiliaceae bacterium]
MHKYVHKKPRLKESGLFILLSSALSSALCCSTDYSAAFSTAAESATVESATAAESAAVESATTAAESAHAFSLQHAELELPEQATNIAATAAIANNFFIFRAFYNYKIL